jgi:hypothetical protein
MRYEFLYDSKESRYSGIEKYYVYDTVSKDYVYDIHGNKTCVGINREYETIYFFDMHIGEHWILEKFFLCIIEEFISRAEMYGIINYRIDDLCIGGQIYYKNKR